MEKKPSWMKSVKHSMQRRCETHDYGGIGTYMVTLISLGREPIFGSLCTEPTPYIKLSPLGTEIEKNQISKIHKYYEQAEVWKHCIMPDHIHLIIRVNSPLPKGKKLGNIISGFKNGCKKAAGHPIFEESYNDRILKTLDQLEVWKRYLDDNPRRLALKIQNRQYFTIQRKTTICEVECCIIGNKLLLEYPEIMPVIVHRHFSEQELQEHIAAWINCSRRGGVLVSAAISPAEKAVLRQAMDAGGKIILLRENGFPQLYKPSGEAFDACAAGRLLQVSPWPYHMEKRTITRQQCLFLNDLAIKIAEKTIGA